MGIAVTKNSKTNYYKAMGLVKEVFNEEIIRKLQGDIPIGHVRYSTTGESNAINAQLLVVHHKSVTIGLVHNDNMVNIDKKREQLEDEDIIFQTSIDTEIVANLIVRYSKNGIENAITKTIKQ